MSDIELIMDDKWMPKQLNMHRVHASEIGSGHGNEIYPPSNFMREKCSLNVHKLI